MGENNVMGGGRSEGGEVQSGFPETEPSGLSSEAQGEISRGSSERRNTKQMGRASQDREGELDTYFTLASI